MTIKASRSALAALGLVFAVTIAGASYGAQVQRAPQPTPLPAPPQQNQVQPAPNRGPDQPFDRRNDQRGDNRGGGLERRLDFLHYELRITQQQQRLWDSFADALRGEMQDGRDRAGARGRGGPGGVRNDDGRGVASVLDRLEQRRQRLATRSDQLDRLVGTLRPLYTSLSADQKRTADRLLFQASDRFQTGGFGRGGRGGVDRGRFGGGQFDNGPGRFGRDGGRDFDQGFDREYR